MNWNEIATALIVALVPVALPLIGRLYWWIATWIEAQITNQRLQRIAHETAEVVAAIGQSVAGPIKEAAVDGKLSDEEKQRLKRIALDALRLRLADLPARLITEQRLSDAIEAAVPASKPDPMAGPASR